MRKMEFSARLSEDEEAILNLVFIMDREDGGVPSPPSPPPTPPPPAAPQPAADEDDMTNEQIIEWMDWLIAENRKLKAEVTRLERKLTRQLAMTMRRRTSERIRTPRRFPYC